MLRFVIFLFLVVIEQISLAQIFSIENWGKEFRNSYWNINSIDTDENGRIMFGSDNAIFTYNGTKVTKIDSLDRIPLSGFNRFWRSFDGKLYLISSFKNQNGLYLLFEVENFRFHYKGSFQFNPQKNDLHLFPFFEINDKNQFKLYTFFHENRLLIYKNRPVTSFTYFKPDFVADLGNAQIIDIKKLSDSTLCILNKKGQLFFTCISDTTINKITKESQKFISLYKSKASDSTIFAITKNQIFTLTPSGKLRLAFKFNASKNWPFDIPSGIVKYHANNSMAIIFDSKNICLLNKKTKSFQNITNKVNLNNKRILDAIIDKDQNLWISTPNNIIRISDLSLNKYNDFNGIPEDEVSAIAAYQNFCFVGGNNWYSILKNKILHVKKQKISTSNLNRVLYAKFDTKGYIWFLTSFTGIQCITTDGVLVNKLPKHLKPGEIFQSFDISRNGTIVFTSNKAIYKLVNNKLNTLKFPLPPENFYFRRIMFTERDCLAMLDLKYFILTDSANLKPLIFIKHNNSNIYNFTIYEDRYYFIGDNLYSLHNGKIVSDTSFVKLPKNRYTYSLIINSDKRVFIGGNNFFGLTRNNIIPIPAKNFNDLQVGEVNRGAFILNGTELWVGTTNGLYLLNTEIYPVSFSNHFELKCTNTKIDFHNISKGQQKVFLPHNFSDLRFYVEHISFINEKETRIVYSYNNRSFDTIPITDNIIFPFAGKPGVYELEYKLINPYGLNTKTNKLIIELLPPWYKTTGAYITYLLMLILFLTIIAIRIYRLQKLKSERERRILQNDLKVIRTQLNTHFIQNAFNILSLNLPKDANWEENVSYIEQLSRYFRKVLNITEKEIHTLEEELDFIEEYLLLQKKIVSTEFNYQILNEEEIDTYSIDVPTMLLQPFVENCLKHAFIKSTRQSHINITVQRYKSGSMIKIIDNGSGLGDVNMIHKGIGTNVSRSRLEIMCLSQKTNEKPYITFQNNEGNPGSTVSIYIPNQGISEQIQ